MDGVKLLDPLIWRTRANVKSSRMVISPSRTQTITLHTNRRIMQPTLGIRLKISTSEVQKQRGDADSASDRAQMMSSRRETPESTDKDQREVHQTKGSSDSMKTRCSNT